MIYVDGQLGFPDGTEKEDAGESPNSLRNPSDQEELQMRGFHYLENEGAEAEDEQV